MSMYTIFYCYKKVHNFYKKKQYFQKLEALKTTIFINYCYNTYQCVKISLISAECALDNSIHLPTISVTIFFSGDSLCKLSTESTSQVINPKGTTIQRWSHTSFQIGWRTENTHIINSNLVQIDIAQINKHVCAVSRYCKHDSCVNFLAYFVWLQHSICF